MAITALAIGVLGAGLGAAGGMMAAQGSGESRSLNEFGQIPFGDYREAAMAQADAQFKLDQQRLMMNYEAYPMFAGQAREQAMRSQKAALELYPLFTMAERKATRMQRKADIRDLDKFSGPLISILERISPGYKNLDKV